ncbi:hypothetical protein ACWGPD_09190 [Streptomyces hirsutus]|uniref:hypothetical protein n=1 Tax=Streptomyces hirsutus TaxID=35620 RepID=UPI00331FBB6E
MSRLPASATFEPGRPKAVLRAAMADLLPTPISGRAVKAPSTPSTPAACGHTATNSSPCAVPPGIRWFRRCSTWKRCAGRCGRPGSARGLVLMGPCEQLARPGGLTGAAHRLLLMSHKVRTCGPAKRSTRP